MYSAKAMLDKSPLVISGAVMGVVNVPIVTGAIALSGPAVSAINLALVGVLSVFLVVPKTTNTAALNELAAAPEVPTGG